MLIRKNGDDINVIIGQTCITYTQASITLPRLFLEELIVNDVSIVIDSLRVNKITLIGDAKLTVLDLRSKKFPQLYFENTTEETSLIIENNIIDISSFNYSANVPKKKLKVYEKMINDPRVSGHQLNEEDISLVDEDTEVSGVDTTNTNEFVVKSNRGSMRLLEDDSLLGMTASRL
jgi:NACalpha-BTF3-like transcription factor